MSPELQDTTRADSNTPAQATEVAIVACARCGSDLRKVGFFEVSVSYQSYERSAGKLVKSYRKQGGFSFVQCGICRRTVDTTAEQLTGGKTAA